MATKKDPMTLDDLRIFRTSPAASSATSPAVYLQQIAESGWVSLRPLQGVNGSLESLTVMLGNPNSFRRVRLLPLLDALLHSGLDTETPIPDSAFMPMPPEFDKFPARLQTILYAGAMAGNDDDELTSLAGSAENFTKAMNIFAGVGLSLLRVGDVRDAVTFATNRKDSQQDDFLSTAAAIELSVELPPAHPTTSPDYGIITDLTPEQMELVERRLEVRRNVVRQKWPFSRMEIGQRVLISPENPVILAKAQRAAHAYSAVSGKVFVTRRVTGGALEVIRIPGQRHTRSI